FCWDQFYTTPDPEPNMISLAKQILDVAKKRDPHCTFSGEELLNFELDASLLDYTWNWDGYMDRKVLTSAFPSPRINSCISSSPLAVKKAFADNLYMNIFPRKAESINGSDYIANYPGLSKALKQCAGLKKQFLPYFTEGELIGECLLTKPLKEIHPCAYTLPDRAIMIIINTSNQNQTFEFDLNLAPWIKSATGKYEMKHYNEIGAVVSEASVNASCRLKMGYLQTNEMRLFEFIVDKATSSKN
ncbi:MAG: hypothetical protein M0R39_16095, partial [Prolixibacteraceae bacterium]|nr:hypothetical protein [Prolixibacteraceae bacterium]